ncbi:tryptophan--tRNA ligase [Elusimicrobiota bacterium]
MTKETVLSGMRPTGRLHLGNYLGALKNWVSIQDDFDCFYFIADWHALMSDYESPENINNNCFDMLCVWLAVGIDPDKSIIFRQSEISEHLELFFIFSALTPLSWLERCPTYKEALQNIKEKDISNYAFLGYPALQAADIALYKADRVPVGKDQLPHLEITREIIRRFNYLYNSSEMVEPKELLTDIEKLTGTDGRKMSKSYGNTIYIIEQSDSLMKKITSMITDPERIRKDDPGHPDICNVYNYHSIFSQDESDQIRKCCTNGSIGCVECKQNLYENIEPILAPIRDKYNKLKEEKDYVYGILKLGNEKARDIASSNLRAFKEAMNFG